MSRISGSPDDAPGCNSVWVAAVCTGARGSGARELGARELGARRLDGDSPIGHAGSAAPAARVGRCVRTGGVAGSAASMSASSGETVASWIRPGAGGAAVNGRLPASERNGLAGRVGAAGPAGAGGPAGRSDRLAWTC